MKMPKLKASPDMDTHDCQCVNAGIDELQECLRALADAVDQGGWYHIDVASERARSALAKYA